MYCHVFCCTCSIQSSWSLEFFLINLKKCLFYKPSPLQRSFNDQAKSHLTSLDLGQSASQQRKRHANMQEKVLGLWNNITLFRRAISRFDGGCVCVHVCVTLCVRACAFVCHSTKVFSWANCALLDGWR